MTDNPPADGLTPEAKAEIQAAIAIIREDRFGQYARTVLKNYKPQDPPADPPKNDPPKNDPPKNDPPAPPPADPPKNDPPADPPKRRSLYWGDLDD